MTQDVWSFKLWWDAMVRLALRNLRGQGLQERLDHLLKIGDQNFCSSMYHTENFPLCVVRGNSASHTTGVIMSQSTVRSLLVAGVATLALATSSCALGVPALVGASDPAPQPTATAQSYDPMDSSSPSAASPARTRPAAPPKTKKYRFGQTVVYQDGLEVTLSKLKDVRAHRVLGVSRGR